MPIPPPPHKLVCPKCGYSKIVKPKSDALDPRDMIGICPRCDIFMEKKKLDALSRVWSLLLH